MPAAALAEAARQSSPGSEAMDEASQLPKPVTRPLLPPPIPPAFGLQPVSGHLAFSCDVSKEEDVKDTFSQIEKSLGYVNYLVNAAGINRDGLLLRTKVDEMVSQLHTNLLGTMLTCKVAVKNMIQQQGGAIVNVGSIVGLKGNSGQSVYSASKAGLAGFSRSLAKEVARKNIRVNMIAPVKTFSLHNRRNVSVRLEA
uniref:Reductase n=1 Tax=Sphaerodactylus townsendi TaxID=933632 RepID=A0ACB8E7N6_9SAUR